MRLIYGWHTCSAALNNPSRIIKHIWLTDAIHCKHLPPRVADVPITICQEEALYKLLGGHARTHNLVHQGIVVDVDPLPDSAFDFSSIACWIMLDHVTDPHNVGAILRVCAALNAGGIIQTTRHTPPETGVLAKAASGALECVPIWYVTNLARTLKELKHQGFWVYGFDETGVTSTWGSKQIVSGKVVYVFGSEGQGLRARTKALCDALVCLPTSSRLSTLNVSHAVAIALYERMRAESLESCDHTTL